MLPVLPATVKPVSTSSKWTKEKAEKAAASGKYMKLENKSNDLLLSGAMKKWAADPTFAYLPDYRIAGALVSVDKTTGVQSHPLYGYMSEQIKPDGVTKLDQNTIVQILSSRAYTIDSVVGSSKNLSEPETFNGPLAVEFRAELARQAAIHVSKPVVKKAPTFTLEQIANLAKSMKESKESTVVEKKPKQKKEGTATATGVTTSRTKSITDRLLKQSAGKAFDVSVLSTKGLSSCKSINLPKGPHSKKVLISVKLIDPASNLPLTKNIVSDNLDSLTLALHQIYPGDASSIGIYQANWNTTKASMLAAVPVAAAAATTAKVGVVTVTTPTFVTMAPMANGVPNFSNVNGLANGVKSPVQTMSSLLGGH
jgi:hypothetical protein